MELKLDIINAFTDTQFKGNPAAVVITDTPLAVGLMQNIASQNNLSETAFLCPATAQQPGLPTAADYTIRWFSPVCEIDFCGHASLASAFVVFSREPQRTRLSLYADAVGVFEITRPDPTSDPKQKQFEMMFPNRMPHQLATVPEALAAGLSLPPSEVWQNTQAYFAIYEDEQQIYALTQQPTVIAQLAPLDVVATAPGTDYDFVSRYFWPSNGSDEDPVTGSIHTGLAPFWSQRLNQACLHAYQASARGGQLNCRVTPQKVYIRGAAVHYLTGTISV
ncbi:PhzF family phenazine biosynthesis protein [Salinimonas marina]|uniref:PhzF family phenazine biosynthesis protein n=1 Tax=Salinimonas marina TaxID=2785918 RepID=A0A7S9HDA1_9ALTE|nr:PhzF family phenazine biosynthesis protein [Salinimonas marina]QPG05341.1 PhzF family phenazine biosynthesis protein [Salinimonas marina]